jgi:hypothetical protein
LKRDEMNGSESTDKGSARGKRSSGAFKTPTALAPPNLQRAASADQPAGTANSSGGGSDDANGPGSARSRPASARRTEPPLSARNRAASLNPPDGSPPHTSRPTTPKRNSTLQLAKKDTANNSEEKKLPEGNPLLRISLTALQNADRDVALALFKAYDLSNSSMLDRTQLLRVSGDLCERLVSAYAEAVRRRHPEISERDLKAAVEKEKEFILPKSEDKEAATGMRKLLMSRAKFVKKDTLSKVEFLAFFPSFLTEIFAATPQRQELACIVM